MFPGIIGPRAPGGTDFTSLIGAEALRKGPDRLFWWEENTAGTFIPVPVFLSLSICLSAVFPNVTLLGLASTVLAPPCLQTGPTPALSSTTGVTWDGEPQLAVSKVPYLHISTPWAPRTGQELHTPVWLPCLSCAFPPSFLPIT